MPPEPAPPAAKTKKECGSDGAGAVGWIEGRESEGEQVLGAAIERREIAAQAARRQWAKKEDHALASEVSDCPAHHRPRSTFMAGIIETGQKGSQMQPNTAQRLAKERHIKPL
jgi:hypothetical protein